MQHNGDLRPLILPRKKQRNVAKTLVSYPGGLQHDSVGSARTTLKLFFSSLVILRDRRVRKSPHLRLGMVCLKKEKRLLHGCAIGRKRKSSYGNHPSIKVDARLKACVELAGARREFGTRRVAHRRTRFRSTLPASRKCCVSPFISVSRSSTKRNLAAPSLIPSVIRAPIQD